MNLRLKLLLVFASGELLLLIFFGYIAYDAAKNTNIKNEIDLLSAFAPQVAGHVAIELKNGASWKSILETTVSHQNDGEIYILVSNKKGELITDPGNSVIGDIFARLNKDVTVRFHENSGSLEVGGKIFVWVRMLLPNDNYELTLVRQAYASQKNAFFKEVGVSLILAAVVLLWVASWAAMYISMLIEKLHKQKNVLKYRSLHDVLTGLPNRALFNDQLQELVSDSKPSPLRFAVCFIDLNRFKDVNDTLGHHIGDDLLLEVSKRLKNSLRKQDAVARLGGDEFAIIIQEVEQDSARKIAEKLLFEIEAPIHVAGHKLIVSGSMGIAMFPEHGDDTNTLLKNADVAMYAAKRSGAHIEFYSNSQEVFTQANLALTQDLREAIEQDQLELYYQPKYNIVDSKVVGVEALVRWSHPELGYISPPDFIQLAEHTGLIRSLSRWVMQRAIENAEVISRIEPSLTVSINLSALYLQDPKFESDIHDLLADNNVDARSIILELTESAMFVNYGKMNELLKRLTNLGFRISVDDFGTGYSTLTNLRRLPISELKIDRSFVDRIVANVEDASIVNAMIGLGKSLNIDVVAEGVESLEVVETLRRFGCNTIQGFLISKAVPLHRFIDWFESGKTDKKPSATLHFLR